MAIIERTRKKILYAEDELVTAKYIMKKIGPAFEVIHATNGTEAWEIYQREGIFDLCLLDLIMPRMGGIELIKLIRSSGSNVPIVILSGSSDEVTEEAISSGANILIKKPPDIDLLSRTLATLINSS